MRIAKYGVLLICAGACSLQAPQQPGMQNEWDIHQTLAAIALHADRLAPFVDQIQPEKWVAAGAPQAYVAQAKTCRNEVRGVAAAARELSRNPEKLTGASLGETWRKWNPALAIVVADRDRLHRRLLLQSQHRLDVELAHDVHVRPGVVPPRGGQLVPQPVPGGTLPFPVRE